MKENGKPVKEVTAVTVLHRIRILHNRAPFAVLGVEFPPPGTGNPRDPALAALYFGARARARHYKLPTMPILSM